MGERHHLTISDAITASRTDLKIRPYSQILIEKKQDPLPYGCGNEIDSLAKEATIVPGNTVQSASYFHKPQPSEAAL